MTLPDGSLAGPIQITTAAAAVKSSSFRQLMTVLQKWAADTTHLQVIWKDQAGPKPKKPFIMLGLIWPIKVPATDHPGVLLETLEGSRRGIVHVQIATEPIHPTETDPEADNLDSMQYAADLVASLDTQACQDAFNAVGIGEAGILMQPTDITVPLETKFERRTAFDFQINTISVLPVDVQVIDEATVTQDSSQFTPA